MIGKRIGNYRIVRLLGEGGMGVVYEAIHDGIGGRVAVKVLRPQFALQPDSASRFFNEARAANLIDHPSIVKIFDYGQLPDGVPYLAMELLSGESLYTRLQRERRLSEPETLRLGRQIATALAAAHAKEVIHRDLKPENIFIIPDSEASGGERVKILDFGIAKLAHGMSAGIRTDTNVVMGTPIYMSPEQCRGGKYVDERTDVYSFGSILFEMLAGQPPFLAATPGEYIGLHLLHAPPPLSSLAPTTSAGMQRLVDSMLAKEPQQRPPSKTLVTLLKSLGNLTSDVASSPGLDRDEPVVVDARSDARGRELPTPNLRPIGYLNTDPAPPPAAMLASRPAAAATAPPDSFDPLGMTVKKLPSQVVGQPARPEQIPTLAPASATSHAAEQVNHPAAAERDQPAVVDVKDDNHERRLPAANSRPMEYRTTAPGSPPASLIVANSSAATTSPSPPPLPLPLPSPSDKKAALPDLRLDASQSPLPGGDGALSAKQTEPRAMLGTSHLVTMRPLGASRPSGDWPPVAQLPANPVIGNLELDSGVIDPAEKSQRPEGQRLRRLGSQATRLMLVALGLTVPNQPAVPGKLSRFGRRLAGGLALVALAASLTLASLHWRRGRAPTEAVLQPAAAAVPPPDLGAPPQDAPPATAISPGITARPAKPKNPKVHHKPVRTGAKSKHGKY